MNRKLVILLLFLVVILFSSIILSRKSSRQKLPNPSVPTFIAPSPASFPSSSPVEEQTLKAQQNAWAQDQNQYNQENPWHSKLPLKSTDYFISYDPTNDSFIATIYYPSSNSGPTEQQLESLKAEAASAIKNLEPSLASKPIKFIPTPLAANQ